VLKHRDNFTFLLYISELGKVATAGRRVAIAGRFIFFATTRGPDWL
jgi:hypothetical protein